jgi:hypothetical protein
MHTPPPPGPLAAHSRSGRPESTEDDVYRTALRFVAFLEDSD